MWEIVGGFGGWGWGIEMILLFISKSAKDGSRKYHQTPLQFPSMVSTKKIKQFFRREF